MRRAPVVAALALATLLLATVDAASNQIASAGRVGLATQAVLASQSEPPECTGSVSSTLVKTGNVSYSGTNVLVVSGPANDTVTQTSGGYTCWVGGAGADKFTGKAGAADQCIVSNASNLGNVKNCTVVARRP